MPLRKVGQLNRAQRFNILIDSEGEGGSADRSTRSNTLTEKKIETKKRKKKNNLKKKTHKKINSAYNMLGVYISAVKKKKSHLSLAATGKNKNNNKIK